MIGPGRWLDEGPSGFNPKPRSWAAGVLVGAGEPSERTRGERAVDRAVGNRIIDHPRQPKAVRRAKQREWKRAERTRRGIVPKPRCGVLTKGTHQPCARFPHETGDHASRAALDSRNRRVDAHRARKAA